MNKIGSLRLQVALVILLFVGSLAALFINSISTLALSRRELEVRDELKQACARMGSAAQHEMADSRESSSADDLNRRLQQIAAEVLAPFVGVEGGFYLADDDAFSGYAFPSEDHRHANHPRRNDPPPLEEPYIRAQSKQSLSAGGGEVLANVLDVGPSRVLVVTGAAPSGQPPRMAVWTMYRLVGPAELSRQVDRYRVSLLLALSGIALATMLSVRLVVTTERQRGETKRLQDELTRSEHLASLGLLLAGVAHEVRNPLAGIRSTVQLWQRLGESARSDQSMNAVVQSVDQLNDIVSRLLLFARSDSSDRQPVDIHQSLRSVLMLSEAAAAERHVEIAMDLDSGDPRVMASGGALQQVFMNLAHNALEAMQQGGRLMVGTRTNPRDRTVEISFSDNGPGVASADRERVFEPFFTTRSAGTGLGLAICREIVGQHGGQVVLANNTSSGATFRVILPLIR